MHVRKVPGTHEAAFLKKAPGDIAGDDLDNAKKVSEKVGKMTLTDVLRARLHVKLSGGVCEHHLRDVSNGQTSSRREQPCDVIESNRKMETHETLM